MRAGQVHSAGDGGDRRNIAVTLTTGRTAIFGKFLAKSPVINNYFLNPRYEHVDVLVNEGARKAFVSDIRMFLNELQGRPGITDAAIAAIESKLGTQLPDEYLQFLKLMDGGEGFIGSVCYVMLWPGEQLIPMSEAYEVQKMAPGLLLFGSDGGGEAYGFDTRDKWQIVQVPFIGMKWDVATTMGDSFSSFLSRLYQTTQ